MSTLRTDDLAELADRDLGERAEATILAAAVMPATRSYQEVVDAVYAECARRDTGIYQRAWNRAVRSQGQESMVTHPVTGGA